MRHPFSGTWRFDRSRKVLTFNGRVIKRSFFNSRPSGIHGATDVAIATGSKARGPWRWRIRRRGDEGSRGFGRYVILSCPFPRSTDPPRDIVIAHLQSGKAEGTTGDAGEECARTNDTGNSTGPHAHIEWWWVAGDRDTRCDIWWALCWRTEEVAGHPDHVNPYPTPSTVSVTEYPIARGELSYRVMWAQWALGLWRIDGRFTASVEAAVKRFQTRAGITPVNGRVGPTTRAALAKVRRRSAG